MAWLSSVSTRIDPPTEEDRTCNGVLDGSRGPGVTNLAEFRKALAARPKDRDLLLRVLRGPRPNSGDPRQDRHDPSRRSREAEGRERRSPRGKA